MLKLLRKLLVDDTAQDLAEYALALAAVALGAAGAAILIKQNVTDLWALAEREIGRLI